MSEADVAPDHGGDPKADAVAIPVFTDPSGQRRRLMRRVGVGASIFLVGALILVGTGLFGGPRTPFSLWSAPRSAAHGHPGTDKSTPRHGGHEPGAPAPGSSRTSGPSPSPFLSPAPSATGAPSPTNPAGHTPPGRNHSKKPRPTKSPHGR